MKVTVINYSTSMILVLIDMTLLSHSQAQTCHSDLDCTISLGEYYCCASSVCGNGVLTNGNTYSYTCENALFAGVSITINGVQCTYDCVF